MVPSKPLDRQGIAALLPHAGSMCLLDGVVAWDDAGIVCSARSHLDPANPLRRRGVLPLVCGVEYALQAACLHGALLAGGVRQAAGYAASLRDLHLWADRLDDPALGVLRVEAGLDRQEDTGLLYTLALVSAHGAALLSARAAIALGPVAGQTGA